VTLMALVALIATGFLGATAGLPNSAPGTGVVSAFDTAHPQDANQKQLLSSPRRLVRHRKLCEPSWPGYHNDTTK